MITPAGQPARRIAPEISLAVAIIQQLAADLRSANPNVRHDAERTLADRRIMAFWADCLGLDHDLPERLREALTQPQPLRRRAHGQAGRR